MSLNNPLEEIESWLRRLVREEVRQAIRESQRNAVESFNPEETKSVMSVKEVSTFLGISQGTIHRLIREERLEHYRVGRRILFSLDDHIRPFLEKSR